jgi:hypothetical protein
MRYPKRYTNKRGARQDEQTEICPDDNPLHRRFVVEASVDNCALDGGIDNQAGNAGAERPHE